MKESRRKTYVLLNTLFIVVLFGAAIAYIAYHVQTIEGLSFHPLTLCIIAILTVILTILMVETVLILIKGMGFSGTFLTLFRIQTASLAASLLTPLKLGIPMKIWLYKKYFGVPYANGAGIVSLEIFIPFTLVGLVGATGIVLYLDPRYFPIPVFILLVSVILLAILLKVEPHAIVRRLKLDPNRKLVRRFISGAHRFQLGIRSTTRNSIILVYTFFIIRHLLSSFRLMAICWLFNLSLPFLDCVFILALAQVLSTMSFLPMGLGVLEASLVFLLSLVGVNSATGLSISVLQRLLTSGIILILGAISAPKLGLNLIGLIEIPQELKNGSADGIPSAP